MINKNSVKNDFSQYWKLNYDNIPLFSERFKNIYYEKWVRMYYLPKQARVPQNKNDYEYINKLFFKTLSLLNINEYYLIISSFNESQGFPDNYNQIADIEKFIELNSINMKEVTPKDCHEDYYCRIALGKFQQVGGMLNILMTKISDYEISNVFLIDYVNHLCVCPYDGGFDLISFKKEVTDKAFSVLRKEFGEEFVPDMEKFKKYIVCENEKKDR